MKAIAKTQAAPGIALIDTPEPELRPGCVKVRVERASVCGTDLHIYKWDEWSAGRIKPPRIIGHEFCGTILEVADDVTDRKAGDFFATESHIVDPSDPYLLRGDGHVAPSTSILGVDVDGGFAPMAVIPAANARPVSPSIPRSIASMMDAIGNAVHTVMDGPVEGGTFLVTGLGPIGLFALPMLRALGAKAVYATEVSAYRIALGESLGPDAIFNPMDGPVGERLKEAVPQGFDGVLEMSGHPSSLDLAIEVTRPGARISLLGVYSDSLHPIAMNQIIFKGLKVHGIVGRRLWETWEQMEDLLVNKGVDLTPIVTHEMPFTDIEDAFALLQKGEAGKVVLTF